MTSIAKLSLLSLCVMGLVGCASRPVTKVSAEDAITEQRDRNLEQTSQDIEVAIQRARQQGAAAESHLATGLFLKGNAALMDGDYATCVVYFQHLSALSNDPFVQKKLAVALIRLGKMKEASVVLESLYSTPSDDESVGLILAGVYGALDREAESRTVYQQVLSKNPKQEDACLFLGKSLAQAKQWAQAEKQYKSCQKLHPTSGIFSYYLGKMFVERDNLVAALPAFEESHRREPGYTHAANALGMLYEQQQKPGKAVDMYLRHLKVKPSDEVILGRLVQTLFMMERFEEVIPHAEKLVDLDTENLNMRLKLGILYTDAKEYDKAVAVFRELLVQAPNSDKILYYLGAIHQEQQKYDQAIDYFAQIPTESGLYMDSSFQVASMLGTLAQREYALGVQQGPVAVRFLENVRRKKNEIADLKVELALLEAGHFEMLEQDEQAIEALRAVSKDKGFTIQHQYYFASLLEKSRHFEESSTLIHEILEKDPKNAHAWNFMGYSLLERGESQKAFTYIEKAVALAPEDGYIRDSLGWYYFKTGNMAQALKELNHAFRIVPQDPAVAKHLAIIHREMRNFTKARGYLEHAMKHARLESERRELGEVMRQLDDQRRIPASTAERD